MVLIEQKRDKIVELIKQSSEIHDILEKTKSDPDILSITGS